MTQTFKEVGFSGTPLHYAAEFGHLHITKYLTDDQGCNPSCLDDLRIYSTSPGCHGGTRGHCEVSYHGEAM